jgi:hypothetical protein
MSHLFLQQRVNEEIRCELFFASRGKKDQNAKRKENEQ